MRDTVVKEVPIKLGLDLQGGIYLAIEIDESQGEVEDLEDAIDRVLTVIRTRVDEFGVTEPDIQKVGTSRIVVQLAGLDDPERAKEIVNRVAFLEWRITDMQELFRNALPAIDAALYEAGVRIDETTAAAAAPSAIEQLLATSDTQATGEDSTATEAEEV
ncbi:MAG: protein translocase subunit SecD, partial [Myxococcota bacterium]|nr:protein translocase subunit SecD [Myxococcota bacterium]